jgi:hypothetical protein
VHDFKLRIWRGPSVCRTLPPLHYTSQYLYMEKSDAQVPLTRVGSCPQRTPVTRKWGQSSARSIHSCGVSFLINSAVPLGCQHQRRLPNGGLRDGGFLFFFWIDAGLQCKRPTAAMRCAGIQINHPVTVVQASRGISGSIDN